MSGSGNPLGLSCLTGRGFDGPALLPLRGSGSLFGGLLLFLLAVVGLQGSELGLVGSFFSLSSVLVSPAEIQAGVIVGAGRCGLIDGLGGHAESTSLGVSDRLGAGGVVRGIAKGSRSSTAGGPVGR